MKKLFFTLFIVLGFYSISQAQRRGDTEFGVTVGGNLSYAETSNYYDSNLLGGFNAGVSLDYYFSRTWSLKIKGTYDQKGYGGGTLSYSDGTELDGVNIRLNYITVPVLAEVHFGRYNNWYLNFGPYIGFLTSATTNASSDDLKSSFNSTDGGIAFTIGVKIPIAQRAKFFIEYGGQAGLANIDSYSGDDSTQNLSNNLNIGIDF